jgi:maleate isomerase
MAQLSEGEDRSVPAPTTRIEGLAELDNGPANIRIGLIELATGEAGEADFHRMLPPGVMFHTARVLNVNPVTPDNLMIMGPRLAAAAEQLLPGGRLDVIAYDCTSGTVVLGFEEIERQIRAARPGIPVVTPITAAIKAIRLYGAGRISLITPYIDDINQKMAEYIEAADIEVLNIASFCMDNDVEMARLTPHAILEAISAYTRLDADAAFVSCTAIRAAEVVEAAERRLGKPVFTSVQCLFWDALRTAGYQRCFTGFGSLFER